MRKECERSFSSGNFVGEATAIRADGLDPALLATCEFLFNSESLQMNLSRILCSSEGEDNTPPREVEACKIHEQDLQNSESQQTGFTVIPDKERKRPYRMSARQRQHRCEHEAYKSRVENLTLDINELRQQIRLLAERQDLYFTRLLLQGQHYHAQVLELSWKFLASLRDERYGLALNVDECRHPSGFSRGVQQFLVKRGRPPFSHRQFVVKSARVLVEINTTGGDATRIQEVRSAGGVCVVEIIASFTGCITRETIVGLFPHIFTDEALVASLVGRAVTLTPRLLLYFDAQQRMFRQVVQADILTAIMALAT